MAKLGIMFYHRQLSPIIGDDLSNQLEISGDGAHVFEYCGNLHYSVAEVYMADRRVLARKMIIDSFYLVF